MSSACIVVSNALSLNYENFIPASKLTVIYPSMHRAQVGAADVTGGCESSVALSGLFRIILVGGLTEGKGQVEAIEALGHLARGGVAAELVIVGDGDPVYRKNLERIAMSNPPEARVTFAGRVKSANALIRSSDVLVVCSRCEAFGRVTIEGMLAGKPVVGARSGATPELSVRWFQWPFVQMGRLRLGNSPPDFGSSMTIRIFSGAWETTVKSGRQRTLRGRDTRERSVRSSPVWCGSLRRRPDALDPAKPSRRGAIEMARRADSVIGYSRVSPCNLFMLRKCLS